MPSFKIGILPNMLDEFALRVQVLCLEKLFRRPLVIKNLADSSIVLGQLVRGRRKGSAISFSLWRQRGCSISAQVRKACCNGVKYDHRVPLRLPHLSLRREPGEEFGKNLN
jgi:hypothetical protein